MSLKAIVNARVRMQEGWQSGRVVVFDETIASIESQAPKGAHIIDAHGSYLCGGLIDLHIHGSGGSDVMDASFEALETISTTLARHGTTAFLATTMSMPKSVIDQAVEAVRRYGSRLSGAKVVGIHLEGPFLNPDYCGAQDARFLAPPDWEWFETLADTVKMVTIAPEIEGAIDFIKQIKSRYPHIICALGHSGASYEKSNEAFRAGASHVTHLFNAMAPYHHRSPGLVGACFDHKEATCDIIADTIHVHPHHLSLAYRIKKDRLVLITDAMRAGCLKEGVYELGGQKVSVREGSVRLQGGTLAGSVLTLDRAIAQMVRHTDMSFAEAIDAASALPAKLLGLNKGKIMPGFDADMVLFDHDLTLKMTIIGGEVVYDRSFEA